MTHVAIFPGTTTAGTEFRAVAGDKQSVGRTAGEALDALTLQLPQESAGTMIIVQTWRSDSLFGSEQQAKLAELMAQWRSARDRSEELSPELQAELDALTTAELKAAELRAAEILRESQQ
jgi:hypothetical protein